jgi:hypothetical protein
LRIPWPCLGRLGGALVAAPAQELVDLSLQRGLDQQPGTQLRQLLDDLGDTATPFDQRTDTCVDLVLDLLRGVILVRTRA